MALVQVTARFAPASARPRPRQAFARRGAWSAAAPLVLLVATTSRAEPAADAGAPSAPSAPSVQVEALSPASPPASGKLIVHFAPSEPNMVLERAPERRRGDHTDHEGWTVVCLAGCTVELDPRGRYQVGGTYVSPAYVPLPPGPGRYTVSATPGSLRASELGVGWLLAGASAFVVGGSTAAIMGSAGALKNVEDGSATQLVFVSALAIGAVGLVLTVTSLAFRAGGDTEVRVEPSAR
ncbi:MAG: hypothetical protein IPF92_15395 [Myxococcales bacterium]|jgi:hypothetical protein|nr:hypothetical protein [Myxococcales bacterium]MBL0195259.1 hypothetical protein [Myxococcales bacterium]HQY60159.1 hypothetical protein [Polyangiaceae bacterium]